MGEEYLATGHHIYSGAGFGRRLHNEIIAKDGRPFVIGQPGEPSGILAPKARAQASGAPAGSGTPSAAEDIAARIASDRRQGHADILARAREQANA